MPTRRPKSCAAPGHCKVLAALLVMALVGSNVAGELHQITERHARCAEHGEMVHVATAALPATPPEAAVTVEDTGHRAVKRSSGNATGHDHDHCYLCPSSRERASLITSPAKAIHRASGSPAHALATASVPVATAVYGLAPKTSPPLA